LEKTRQRLGIAIIDYSQQTLAAVVDPVDDCHAVVALVLAVVGGPAGGDVL
jgi:hypothetical protein